MVTLYIVNIDFLELFERVDNINFLTFFKHNADESTGNDSFYTETGLFFIFLIDIEKFSWSFWRVKILNSSNFERISLEDVSLGKG